MLEPLSFSPPVLEILAEESCDEEISHEVTQEEELQEAKESLLKLQSNQDVEEGELLLDKPINFGRISNREVKEETTSK
jgi:predicted glycosyl hydrolase (DUF1957 family)